jgi:hypothetical protein
MTDHEKFNELVEQLGGRKKLAAFLGMAESSVKNQLAPAKELPRWARSMLYVQEGGKNKAVDLEATLDHEPNQPDT